jgi:hypothetical protein
VVLDGRSFWAHVNGTYMESPLSISDVASQARERLGLPSLSTPHLPAGLRSSHQERAEQGIPSVHDAIFYWRDDALYAVRQGDYKAAFFTRSGFGLDPPVPHNPPLLFDLSWDYGEAFPLNTTVSPFNAVLAQLEQTAQHHLATITKGVSQYEDISWKVAPCCNKPFNETEALMFLERGEYGLALWDSCVCNPENAFRPDA